MRIRFVRRPGSCRKNFLPRSLLASLRSFGRRQHSDARCAFAQQGINRAVGANFRAALLAAARTASISNRGSTVASSGSEATAPLRAQRRFEFAGRLWRHRFGSQSQIVIFVDHFVARCFRLHSREYLERAIARKIHGLAGRSFNRRDEFGIKAQALFSERDKRRRLGRIRPRRKHSRRGPGSLPPRLLAIDHDHAQFFGRKVRTQSSRQSGRRQR